MSIKGAREPQRRGVASYPESSRDMNPVLLCCIEREGTDEVEGRKNLVT